MVASFGIHDGYQLARFPADRLIELNPRVDIWMLLRRGALVPGTTTELIWRDGGGRLAAHGVNVELAGVSIRLVWDTPMAGVDRPWWQCPACGRRCRFLYLRDTIRCARCHGLENASDHLRRQTRGVGSVERLRRRLGGCELRPFAPLPPRRRGRSQAYHEKLAAMIHDEEEKLLDHLGGVVHDLKRRIRVRKARHRW